MRDRVCAGEKGDMAAEYCGGVERACKLLFVSCAPGLRVRNGVPDAVTGGRRSGWPG